MKFLGTKLHHFQGLLVAVVIMTSTNGGHGSEDVF